MFSPESRRGCLRLKIYLMRHGEPSYSLCTKRGLIGQGRDLAALNEEGIKQVLEASKALVHSDAQIILSSPYTRALQSAAIVAKETGLITEVVHDLHEWLPDTTFQYGSYQELKLIFEDFKKHKGILPSKEYATAYTKWEPLAHFKERVRVALLPYVEQYDAVILMGHGMVLQSLSYQEHYLYGEIKVIEFTHKTQSAIWPFEREE